MMQKILSSPLSGFCGQNLAITIYSIQRIYIRRSRFFPRVAVLISVDSICRSTQGEMSQYSGKIVFYEGKCFMGRRLGLFGDCENFQDRGFMNRVNSIRVESGAWVCFDHPGQHYMLEKGEYPDFQRWNAHNDHMGSCKPIKMHGEHYRMELFDGQNFTGHCVELCEDCPFLQSTGFNKNSLNSIKVYGDGAYVSQGQI